MLSPPTVRRRTRYEVFGLVFLPRWLLLGQILSTRNARQAGFFCPEVLPPGADCRQPEELLSAVHSGRNGACSAGVQGVSSGALAGFRLVWPESRLTVRHSPRNRSRKRAGAEREPGHRRRGRTAGCWRLAAGIPQSERTGGQHAPGSSRKKAGGRCGRPPAGTVSPVRPCQAVLTGLDFFRRPGFFFLPSLA